MRKLKASELARGQSRVEDLNQSPWLCRKDYGEYGEADRATGLTSLFQ